ncbi:hypothetical protein TD95_003736 [Thielaviopsis punctulata]|uniref:SH3 domain-containing protein n=1 Tax=Thielaviopsis punctulata TaxID=72032 RepID=A0A0F4Z8N3_9PEZI|nr:hypothetical protein TD95_003736 [Thielaviopsis punctulata]
MADRQKILETNRSIRTIKQELENLLGYGAISESAFDSISSLLPAEASVRGGAASSEASASPAPVHSPQEQFQPPAGPPSYNQTPAPDLPTRAPAPVAPPSRPVISTARALYRYSGADARDLAFEKEDYIDVFEHMNPDWWMGRNQRTGAEGIFPANYVLVDMQKGPAPYFQQPYGYQPQPYGQPGPAAPMNPYNAQNPPMAVAEGNNNEAGKSKLEENGKKFGKKLGNAAIFGAGATLGSNLVNSIF